MAVITISDTGGNWNSTATWVGGVVPTTADSILATATSGQLTMNVAASILFADLSLYTNTLTCNSNLTFTSAGSTTTFGSGMNFAGTNGIVCNVNHTFIQNTTNRIPNLSFGAGTKTLSTNLYVTNFTSTSTTGLCNGSNLNIYGNATFSSGRFGGTSEFVLAGTGTLSLGVPANNTGKLTIDTTGTTTSSAPITFGPNSTFKYIKGTVNFTSTNYASRGIWSYANNAATNTLILNTPQTFNIFLIKNDSSGVSTFNIQPFSGTSVNIGNCELYNIALGALQHTLTSNSGTTINFDTLYINSSNGNGGTTQGKLQLQSGRTFAVNNIYGINSAGSSNDGVPSINSFLIQSTIASGSTSLNLIDGSKSLLGFINFTDVDASGGNTIRTLEGVLTRTTNIVSTLTTGGGGGSFTFVN